MKKYLIILFASIRFACYSQVLFNGYYVTLSNDTIQTKIKYYDILALQKELHITDSMGNEKIIYPKDIKGFSIKKDTSIKLVNNFSYSMNDVNREKDDLFFIDNGGENLGEFSPDNSSDKFKLFDSLDIKKNEIFFKSYHNRFIRDVSNYKNYIKTYNYYFYSIFEPRGDYSFKKHKFLISILHTFKNDSLITFPLFDEDSQKRGKLKKFYSKLVADYPLLSKMIKEGDFPLNLKIIFDSYVEWKTKKSLGNTTLNDTLVVMRGILDAKKYCKSAKYFWSVFTGTCVFFAPGAIMRGFYSEKFRKNNSINIPNTSPYAQNTDYMTGYKAMAKFKNQKAVDRGLIYGLIIEIGVIVPIIIIASHK